MSAVELESGVAAVVEFGGPPAQHRVAPAASGFVSAGLELTAMHVGVAVGAIFGGRAEGDVADGVFHHRLVASQAVHRGVAAEQWVCRSIVVEAAALFPGDR